MPFLKSPRTREEWQEAVNMARFLLLIDSARQYGLIEGGPQVDYARAEDLLARGRRRGIFPAPHDELMALYLTPPAAPAADPQ